MNTPNLQGTLYLLISLFVSVTAFPQGSNVSIGTDVLKEKAVLWVKGNGTQGIIIPVVTNRSSVTGLNNTDDKGMVIFDASDNKIYYWNGTGWVEVGASAGGGEANTASNVGTGGVGVYKQKTGVNLEFNKINSASNRVAVTSDFPRATAWKSLDPAELGVGVHFPHLPRTESRRHPASLDSGLRS